MTPVSSCRTAWVLLIALTFSLSCAKREQPVPQNSPPSILVSTPPFRTKEPNTYQAVRSITFTAPDGSESTVTTVGLLRDGELRREEETLRGKRIVNLELPGGRFLLLPDEKIYAPVDGPPENNQAKSLSEDPPEPYLHTAPIQSTYENLGTDTLNGTTATKYRVVVNNSTPGTVSESETFIWIDESLGMPVKSTTRTSSGTRTMALSRITLTVDRALFEILKDYQKVDIQLLRARIREF
jgi:hypothetical protein